MRRSQKIMSMILALLMLLSSLPVWAEGEPIVIVESVETPAPQAENTPAGTAAPKNTPAAFESATSAPEPAQSEAAAPGQPPHFSFSGVFLPDCSLFFTVWANMTD